MMHHKRRTWVHGHDRRIGLGRTAHVKGHVREFETRGQVERKHERRHKIARAVDEAIRAEQCKPISSKKNLEKWEKHPETTDISGVDS